jgi:8-oxo-dGTP diphosphatase
MATAAVVFLVRHAKAGERRVWFDADDLRPLSKQGFKQAEAIAERLAAEGATELYSSPFLRCVQTLEPLADRLDIKIHADDRLAEDQPFEGALDLLGEVPDGAVLCSHGDVIPATIDALVRRGMEVQTPPDWRKGTVWVLRRKGDRITKGRVWPPPT